MKSSTPSFTQDSFVSSMSSSIPSREYTAPHCDARVCAWLRIAHARGLGYSQRRQLLQALDFQPHRLFQASRSGARDHGRDQGHDQDPMTPLPDSIKSWIDDARTLDVSADLRWLDDNAHTLLTLDDVRYPALLKEISDPPLVLYVRGDVATLEGPQLAMVGSRTATPGGMKNARRIAGDLARAGLTITSGLALGIDGAAHGAAIEAGGKTIAVMATGADLVYPARHRQLAEAVVACGALVSEFRCGTEARPSHFARRNRLISGLSLGTLIVEGAEKSGSLITARLAGTQGRDVFAMPGPAGVAQYRGCHRLIRQGATLVEEAGHLLEDLGWRVSNPFQSPMPSENSPETDCSFDFEENCQSRHALLAHIGYSPISVDALVTESGFTIANVTADVITLEVQGFINSLPGGFVVRTT